MAIKVEATPKPVAGVQVGEIPEDLAKLLAVEVPKVLSRKESHELTLTGETKAEAETHAGYARAWGMRQSPPLAIRRQPARQKQPDHVIRMSVQVHNPDAPHPGRPKGSTNSK